MMIRESLANIIIGDRTGHHENRHITEMPRQNPVLPGPNPGQGEQAELVYPFNIDKLLEELRDEQNDNRHLFIIG